MGRIIIVILPIALWVLPVSYFDTGESLCLSKQLLDMECYGCGMTRGIMHLMHGDILGAWMFNKLSFFVLPLLAFLWLRNLARLFNIKSLQFLEKF